MTMQYNRRHFDQQVILDHAKHPKYYGKTQPIDHTYQGNNPYCGDLINLTLRLNLTGNSIEEARFEGEGCAISIASADLMAEAIQGKTISEALEMIENFRQMMKGEFKFPQSLRKLNSLQGVSHFPMRIKCATLGWHTLKAALTEKL